MMYIRRSIEDVIRKAARLFPCVLVTGARQVGKTTLLKHLTKGIPYLTLDDPILLQSAVNEAGSFFQASPPPVVVDEIQYAPDLFRYIKMLADESGEKGQFYLTGSQQFSMMKNISESLSGRVAIVNLPGLSLREINRDGFKEPFLPSAGYISARKGTAVRTDYRKIWEIIHKGSMPAMYAEAADWQMFYAAYTKTYIERDVRGLAQVGDALKFTRFLAAVAARTSQMLNLTALANETGVSVPTAERWLSILVSSNLVYLLRPYFGNLTKRMVKTPKLYFMDTGLAAYLTRWNTSETLEAGAMAGAFFETFAVAEVLKSYYNNGIIEPPLYYYRDKEAREIDLLIEQDGVLYPVEIKKTANPAREHTAAFSVLGDRVGAGGVVCLYDREARLSENSMAIPVTWL